MLDAGIYWEWRYLLRWPPMAALTDNPRFPGLQNRFEAEMARQRAEVLELHEAGLSQFAE
jgi:hypothetical protein